MTFPARLVPAGLDSAESIADWVQREPDILYLVTRAEQFTQLAAIGLDVALVPLRFSVTDQRASWRAHLGGLLMPWRWRRLLLNEGVTALSVPRQSASLPVAIGAILAGVRLRASPRYQRGDS